MSLLAKGIGQNGDVGTEELDVLDQIDTLLDTLYQLLERFLDV